MGRIRQMSPNEVEKVLKRYGFEKISQKGSHRKWRNVDQRLQVIVPFHRGRNLPIGTLCKIISDASIPLHEWQSD